MQRVELKVRDEGPLIYGRQGLSTNFLNYALALLAHSIVDSGCYQYAMPGCK